MKSASFSIAILNFFLGMVNIFILQKISPERDRLQLFCTFAIILDKFSAPTSSNFFLWKIWVITNSKSAPNITWWVYWMRNRGLLFPIFCTFFIHVTLLTKSALILPFKSNMKKILCSFESYRIICLGFWGFGFCYLFEIRI